MKYCSNCGKQLPDEALFCDECGSKVISYKQAKPENKTERETERKAPKKKGSFPGLVFKFFVFIILLAAVCYFVGEKLPGLFEEKPHFTIPNVPGISTENNDNNSNSSSNSTITGNNDTNSDTNNNSNNNFSIIPDGDPSPAENLSFADFSFYDDYVAAGGKPAGAVPVEGGYADGDWKYEFRIFYDAPDGYMYDELGMAFVDVEGESMRLELYPRYADNGSELIEIHDDKKYQPFTGGYIASEGAVKLIGNNTVIYITEYYAYGGREYMIATAWFAEDDSQIFLMTRGQN